MKKKTVVSLLLLGIVLVSPFVTLDAPTSFVPLVYAFPSSTKVDYRSWFLNYFDEFRIYMHSALNRSGMWIYNWNLTSSYSSYAHSREEIGKWIYLTLIAYNLTGNNLYLTEAKWLMDEMMKHQGEGCALYDKTWRLYEPSKAYYGHIQADMWVWLSWQKLDEYGVGNYNVTEQISLVKDLAYYNNDTDLAWEYYYWQRTGRLSNYVVNTFSPIFVILGYLTHKGVHDYTNEMKRCWHATQRFLMSDKMYKYKWTYESSDPKYTLFQMLHYMLAYAYVPNVFNSTAMQETCDAFTNPMVQAYYETALVAGIYVFMDQLVDFTPPDTFYRAFEHAYFESIGDWLEVPGYKKRLTDSKARANWFTLPFMIALGEAAMRGWSTELRSPEMQGSSPNFYFPNSYSNYTYILSSPTYLCVPMWTANWLSSRLDGTSGASMDKPKWDSETNRYKSTLSWGEVDFTFYFDRIFDVFNMTASKRVSWGLIDIRNYFQEYPFYFIFKNGTRVQLDTSQDTVYTIDPPFALEVRLTAASAKWIFIDCDNSTIEQDVYGDNNQHCRLKSRITWYYEKQLSTENLYLDEQGWVTVTQWIAECLTQLDAGSPPLKPENITTRTQNYVIHCDGEIVQSTHASSRNLTTIVRGEGEVQTTFYVPTDIVVSSDYLSVICNVTYSKSWNYTLRLLTVDTTMPSSASITIIAMFANEALKQQNNQMQEQATPYVISTDGTLTAISLEKQSFEVTIETNPGTNVTTQIAVPYNPTATAPFPNDNWDVICTETQWGKSWNSTSRILTVWAISDGEVIVEIYAGSSRHTTGVFNPVVIVVLVVAISAVGVAVYSFYRRKKKGIHAKSKKLGLSTALCSLHDCMYDWNPALAFARALKLCL